MTGLTGRCGMVSSEQPHSTFLVQVGLLTRKVPEQLCACVRS